jgi:hypothetical protein
MIARLKQARNVANVVADAELLLDDPGDAAAGPDFAAEAVRLGPCHRKTGNRRSWASLSRSGRRREGHERSTSWPPWAASASQELTAASDTPRAVAISRCFQPSWFSRGACRRGTCLKAGPGNGSGGMNHGVVVRGSMAAAGEQHQDSGLASHPAWNCSLARPNHLPDGELTRGEVATIASPQVPPVDVADAVWRNGDSCRGVADEWHLDLERTSQWRNWVATQSARIHEKSQI